MKPWSEDDVETMAGLYAEGLSYGEIAKRMGCERNSVAGVAHRYRDRFPMRSAHQNNMVRRIVNEQERQRRAAAREAERATREWARAQKALRLEAERAEATEALAFAAGHGGRRYGDFAGLAMDGAKPVAMSALKADSCRLVLTDFNDPPMADPPCCGRKVKDGKPYCAAHCRLLYQPREKRAA